MRNLRRQIIFGLSLSLSACALSEEGAVDLRRTAMPTEKVGEPGPDQAISNEEAVALPLQAKNFSVPGRETFVEGDSIALHLRTAFIHDFYETGSPWRGFRINGEIAIVANAFEMNGAKGSRELDFTNLEAGRLVFYSDDVEPGQFLNFNNMPIYGPIEYKGTPFAVRFGIFELDTNSEEIKALIGALASIGSVAYPPAAPALGLLNTLGKSFLSGSRGQNDTEFRYTMILDPMQGSPRINHFVLEVGNYVLVRSEDRTQDIPWDSLVLNENEGRLYWKDGRPAQGAEENEANEDMREPYKENTYLVIEINKTKSSKLIDLEDNTYEALLKVLEQNDRAKAQSIEEAAKEIGSLFVPRLQSGNFNEAKQLLAEIAPDAENDNSKALQRSKARRILELIAASIDPQGRPLVLNPAEPEKGPALDAQQLSYVSNRLIANSESLAGKLDNLSLSSIASAFDYSAGPAKAQPIEDKLKDLLDVIVS